MKKSAIAIIAALMLACAPALSARTLTPTVACAQDDDAATRIDQFLNSYEKFADRYASTCRLINEGDTGALAKLSSMQKEAERLQKQLEALNADDFTPEQKSRLSRIQEKLLNAM